MSCSKTVYLLALGRRFTLVWQFIHSEPRRLGLFPRGLSCRRILAFAPGFRRTRGLVSSAGALPGRTVQHRTLVVLHAVQVCGQCLGLCGGEGLAAAHAGDVRAVLQQLHGWAGRLINYTINNQLLKCIPKITVFLYQDAFTIGLGSLTKNNNKTPALSQENKLVAGPVKSLTVGSVRVIRLQVHDALGAKGQNIGLK